eukprot:9605813-Alexandrium_andersonii.AAC.1
MNPGSCWELQEPAGNTRRALLAVGGINHAPSPVLRELRWRRARLGSGRGLNCPCWAFAWRRDRRVRPAGGGRGARQRGVRLFVLLRRAVH